MKTLAQLRFITVLAFIIMPLLLIAQTDKKAAEAKKLETAVDNAQAKVTLNENKIANADSLIEIGNQMISESKEEIKTLQAERKLLDKEYSTNKKPLTKQSTSKDKEEATKAKTDLKGLDMQYKTDAKTIDTKLKEANKKNTTGIANVTKGKAAKKNAEAALKTSQESLDMANEKYEAATGTSEEPVDEGKKKKK